MKNRIELNERASLDRPAWTSEQKTGMFEAYKHLHSVHWRRDDCIVRDYFVKSKGLLK